MSEVNFPYDELADVILKGKTSFEHVYSHDDYVNVAIDEWASSDDL